MERALLLADNAGSRETGCLLSQTEFAHARRNIIAGNWSWRSSQVLYIYGSVCIHAKSINSRAPCVTPYSTMSLHVTCLYWYNAELRKAQSLKAVLVGELCEAAYGRFDAAAPLTHRQQQSMRMYTAHLLSRIKRVTSECDNHSRFVWPREGTSSLLVEDHTLISQRCMRLLKGELKRRRCLKFILVCQLCLAA